MKAPPIKLTPCNHLPNCHGFRWLVLDEKRLAYIVAWVVVGRFNHAEQLLNRLNKKPNIAHANTNAKQQAILRLTIGGSITAYHRDGWIFQIISWIAACIEANGKIATSVPHYQLASKGMDGLLVPLTDDGKSFEQLTICEDKATENARSTITSQVWPEFEEIETGKRDSELIAGLTAILQRYQVPDVERLLESVHWEKNKHYRVSVTANPSEAKEEAEREKLFNGYDAVVNGPNTNRRRAETLELKDLRVWMNSFCKQVIEEVKTL